MSSSEWLISSAGGGGGYEIFSYPSVFVIMKPIKNIPYSLEDMKLRPKERGISKDRGRIN